MADRFTVARPTNRFLSCHAAVFYRLLVQSSFRAMPCQKLRLVLGDLGEFVFECFGDTCVERPSRLAQQSTIGCVGGFSLGRSVSAARLEFGECRSTIHAFRQLGDAVRDLPRLILRHQIRRSASTRLRFEVDVSDCKVVGVADVETYSAIFLDGSGWREAALGHVRHTVPSAMNDQEHSLSTGQRVSIRERELLFSLDYFSIYPQKIIY